MLEVDVETGTYVYLIRKVIQDINVGTKRLDGPFHRDNAARQIREERIDLEILIFEAAENGSEQISEIKVTEIRPGILSAYSFAHLEYRTVIDIALGLRDLEHSPL